MNTFVKNDNETRSLLNEEVIIEKKKQKSASLFSARNVMLVGGLVATGFGTVGLRGNALTKSAASYKLGQDRPTIRLSVGCTPQDVLSLLPFEPKSWRGALLIVVFSLSVCRRIVSAAARRRRWGSRVFVFFPRLDPLREKFFSLHFRHFFLLFFTHTL
jgi:hypothetical protein